MFVRHETQRVTIRPIPLKQSSHDYFPRPEGARDTFCGGSRLCKPIYACKKYDVFCYCPTQRLFLYTVFSFEFLF